MVKGLTKKVVLYALPVLAMLLYLLFKYFLISPPVSPTVHVPALKLHYTTVPVIKTYIGITQSIASVAIRARVKGFLTEMHFIEGKSVQGKQLLFVIDPKPFQAKLAEAEGRLAKSLALEAFQKVQYERMKILVRKGDVSQSRHDEVKAQYEAAQAQVQVDSAAVTEAKINLSYCYMNAPFDGVIGKRYVDVGNLVGSGENTLLAIVNQLDPIYIQFSPSVADFSEMLKYRHHSPFPVTAHLPENEGLLLKGELQLVNNEANMPTSTIFMRAIVHNPERLILPGLYVQTQLYLGENPHTLCIPKSAIMEDQGQQSVFIVDAKGEVKVVEIETAGEYQNQAIVRNGLKEGQIVLLSALQQLQVGMRVIPQL